MSKPIWHSAGRDTDEQAMAFMSGDDVLLDRHLFPHDLRATAAHIRGLQRIGLLSAQDARRIERELQSLGERFESGDFVLDQRYEDGHSAIESELSERLGELGRRIHLGRSRNDQVAAALRLFMLDALDSFAQLAGDCAAATRQLADAHNDAPMPGYTHLQRAVPSTVGLWMGSFAEGFADVAELARLTRGWIDSSPLGSAAGYGVSLPLDRRGVADDLGFARVQQNPMQVQAARGRYELQVLTVGWQAMQEVRRLGWDLVLFSSQEFGFVRLGEGHCTGSSIMPNKRNPDMAELLRARHALVGGAIAELMQTIQLPSGYQRDLQMTKAPLIRGVSATTEALRQLPPLLGNLSLDLPKMAAAIDAPMQMTARALELAAKGMPFRDAYRQIAKQSDKHNTK